ncbi:MAG: dihydropteroate synthase [Epsilonproteobacteria bacterium]|nr:dihydropteroate synthase [Campylobacterota bacterium]NPA89437.1 dihydropteroate synthase [Campylobacterota bacterium]
MEVFKLNPRTNLRRLMEKIGVDPGGIGIMAQKELGNLFFIEALPCGGANILKQDALSIGAELAVPRGTPNCSRKVVDALLMATTQQLRQLVKKEKTQPFQLKELAKKLESFLNPPKFPLQLMGVINANDDSFFSGSRFKGEEAVKKIEEMIEEGADIIDLGGVSSRPGSKYPGEEVELERVKPILDAIYQNKLYEKVKFSLDTFSPKVLQYGLERGVTIANDITGGESGEYLQLVAEYGAQLVIMHKKGDPETMQKNPYYRNVILEVDHFFRERIARATQMGVKEIILDVGIGFGKRLVDNMLLLRHLNHFTHFGYPLLVGASRKSLIAGAMEELGKNSPPPEERLPGSLILHREAVENGASIIRCHDVKEHYQGLKVAEVMEEMETGWELST